MSAKTSPAARVAACLLNKARRAGVDVQTLPPSYYWLQRRRTPILEKPPPALTRQCRRNLFRQARVRGGARRAGIAAQERFPDEGARLLDGCRSPVLEDGLCGRSRVEIRRPGGLRR